MPVMDGFEFLEAYDQLPEKLQGPNVVIMLTNSLDPDDKARADSSPNVASDTTKSMDADQLMALGGEL